MPPRTTHIISLCVVVLVAIAGLAYLIAPFMYAQNGRPANELLGAWKLTDELQNGTLTPIESGHYAFVWGFIADDQMPDTGVLREYQSYATSSLYALEMWKLKKESGRQVLETYYYFPANSDTPLTPDTRYDVHVTAGKSMELRRLGLDGLPDGYGYVFTNIRDAQAETAIDFSRSQDQNRRICDALLNGKSVGDDAILLPITCSVNLGKGESVEFTENSDGSIVIFRGGKTMLSIPIEDSLGLPFLSSSSVFFEDVTFDGYADLQVVTSRGAYNASKNYYAYDPSSHSFIAKPILADLVNASFDAVAKTITTFDKGRGLGDIYQSDTYHFENKSYALIRSEVQDIISAFDNENAVYQHVISERRNGVMQEVKKETLTQDQVFGSHAQ